MFRGVFWTPGLPRILFPSKALPRDRSFHVILKISLRAKKVEDDLIWEEFRLIGMKWLARVIWHAGALVTCFDPSLRTTLPGECLFSHLSSDPPHWMLWWDYFPPGIIIPTGIISFYCYCLQILMGFVDGSDGRESACKAGNLGSVPGLGRFQRNSNPLQYTCLENSMDRRAWWVTVHWRQRVGYNWVTSTFAFQHLVQCSINV